jgi:hypothetical protein
MYEYMNVFVWWRGKSIQNSLIQSSKLRIQFPMPIAHCPLPIAQFPYLCIASIKAGFYHEVAYLWVFGERKKC